MQSVSHQKAHCVGFSVVWAVNEVTSQRGLAPSDSIVSLITALLTQTVELVTIFGIKLLSQDP